MKAEGSSPIADAQHVQANCLLTREVELLELSFFREVWLFVFHELVGIWAASLHGFICCHVKRANGRDNTPGASI